MNNFSRYTVFIFLGFLIALIAIVGLSSLFSRNDMPDPTQPQLSNTSFPKEASDSASENRDVRSFMLSEAKKEVTKLTNISQKDIVVEKVEYNQWPNTALGCPKPGFLYAQAIVPGYLIELKTANELFEFHTDSSTEILLCQSKVLEE